MTDANPGALPTRTLPNANSINRHFVHKELCPQQSDRVACLPTIEIFLTTETFSFLSINKHLDNYPGYTVLKEININLLKLHYIKYAS